jgi:hypothetical protein
MPQVRGKMGRPKIAKRPAPTPPGSRIFLIQQDRHLRPVAGHAFDQGRICFEAAIG